MKTLILYLHGHVSDLEFAAARSVKTLQNVVVFVSLSPELDNDADKHLDLAFAKHFTQESIRTGIALKQFVPISARIRRRHHRIVQQALSCDDAEDEE